MVTDCTAAKEKHLIPQIKTLLSSRPLSHRGKEADMRHFPSVASFSVSCLKCCSDCVCDLTAPNDCNSQTSSSPDLENPQITPEQQQPADCDLC